MRLVGSGFVSVYCLSGWVRRRHHTPTAQHPFSISRLSIHALSRVSGCISGWVRPVGTHTPTPKLFFVTTYDVSMPKTPRPRSVLSKMSQNTVFNDPWAKRASQDTGFTRFDVSADGCVADKHIPTLSAVKNISADGSVRRTPHTHTQALHLSKTGPGHTRESVNSCKTG